MTENDHAAQRNDRVLVLSGTDNVGVALVHVLATETVTVQGATLTASSDIPMGHKIALRDIAEGEDILKYGEAIGVATADIGAGDHVHVHNVVGKRAGQVLE